MNTPLVACLIWVVTQMVVAFYVAPEMACLTLSLQQLVTNNRHAWLMVSL